MKIIKSEKFNKWYRKLDMTQKTVIDIRITRILINKNFGVYKKIDNIFELKFKNGIRVSYALNGTKIVLLLNGGGKNNKREQNRDIKIAKNIFEEFLDGK